MLVLHNERSDDLDNLLLLAARESMKIKIIIGLIVIFSVGVLTIKCTTIERGTVSANYPLASSPSPQIMGQTPSPTPLFPSPLPIANSPIRSIDFRKVTYRDLPDYSKPKASRVTPKAGEVTPSFITYGDATGDGNEEAMVTVSIENRGSALPYYVYIFTLENRKPKLIWHFETGDRAEGGLRQVFAENGKLEVDLYGKNRVIGRNLYLGDEGLCCPRAFTRTRYKWNGKNFQQDGEPAILENPQGHGSPIMPQYRSP